MKPSSLIAFSASLFLLSACGGDSGTSPITPPAPAPTPAPTPTPTPTPTPSTPLAKLKAAAATGSARRVADFGVAISNKSATAYTSGVAIAADDPKIRFLGGSAKRGTVYPYTLGVFGQAVTSGDPTTLSTTTGLPATRYGSNNGYEFILPAGATSFEAINLRAGSNTPLQLEIDGIFANDAGFDNGWTVVGAGSAIYSEFTFPALTKATRFKLYTGSGRAFLGLRLPAGAALSSEPAPTAKVSVVFQGDSITEGTGSNQKVYSWPMQAALRLGIDDPIVVAVGGSGYLRRRATTATAGFNFRERIEDVTKAVNGAPPDAVVVAGGINDCVGGAPYTPAETGVEALEYFKALRAAAPNMLIFVVGPFASWPAVPYPASWTACRDSIFSAADQVSGTYKIDVSGWVTTSNRDTIFNQSVDNVHPTPAGHAFYGEQFTAAFLSIINGL